MKACLRLFLCFSLLLAMLPTVKAQEAQRLAVAQNLSDNKNEPRTASSDDKKKSGNASSVSSDKKEDKNSSTTANGSGDEKKSNNAPTTVVEPVPAEISDPLIRLLVAKGVINANEGKAVGVGGTPAEQRNRLANLLLSKGLITRTEFDVVLGPVVPMTSNSSATAGIPSIPSDVKTANVSANNSSGQTPAVNSPVNASASAQTAPAVIAAIAPIRVLQLEGAKRDGLIPDIKLGSGAKLKLYGFFKASSIYDTSSPGGNDFPLPGFLGDSGPNGSPEFHLKVRALRLGANFEWLDPSPKTSVTGRVELDFEGDFTRVVNRNISSIRSSQPSLRLAWMRIDRVLGEKTSGFALFGQDWTPFASSTVPNTVETTAFHLAYGNTYERAPQFRFGLNQVLGGKRNFKLQPEFAIVLPAFGNTPSDTGNQLGFGERQGPDSKRPELQGRLVLQFQLDKAAGVVPAQLIASFTQGERRAIVRAADVPLAFRSAFPSGAEVTSERWGYTAEMQLPTRYVTVIGKYYNGSDLRFYFGGQLLSTFNDTSGLTGVATTPSIDGSSTVAFGLRGGTATVAPQRPVRAQGGFINFGFPLSRIFGADPKGRNAGWTAYLHYGYDQAMARDARRFGGRTKSDVFMGSIWYKLNSFTSFVLEQSLFRTRAANNSRFDANGLPLFRGIPSRETHNNRTEFAVVFTF